MRWQKIKWRLGTYLSNQARGWMAVADVDYLVLSLGGEKCESTGNCQIQIVAK